jgi:transcription factor E
MAKKKRITTKKIKKVKRILKKKSKPAKKSKVKPEKKKAKKEKVGLGIIRIPAIKRKVYREEQRLWKEKLNTILSDRYIRQLLIDLAGENTLEIVRNFRGEVSDEDLAKKLKLKISDVRATLNKLHNKSLVYYVRQKDNETGWYSYSWVLNKPKVELWANESIQQRENFGNDGNERYFCARCGLDSLVEFVEASACEFRCAKCEKNLEYLDQGKFKELVRM